MPYKEEMMFILFDLFLNYKKFILYILDVENIFNAQNYMEWLKSWFVAA